MPAGFCASGRIKSNAPKIAIPKVKKNIKPLLSTKYPFAEDFTIDKIVSS